MIDPPKIIRLLLLVFRAAIRGQLREGEHLGFSQKTQVFVHILDFLIHEHCENRVQFYPRNSGFILDFEIHGAPWILPWFFIILGLVFLHCILIISVST
jgi:hypothetical protein